MLMTEEYISVLQNQALDSPKVTMHLEFQTHYTSKLLAKEAFTAKKGSFNVQFYTKSLRNDRQKIKHGSL
jgi:hypothetical protein